MATVRKERTTRPVEKPAELTQEELVAEYEKLAEGMKAMKGLFPKARGQTHTRFTEKVEAEKKSLRDPLTNLFNKRYLLGENGAQESKVGADSALYAEVARAWREHEPLSMLFVDADKFKQVNDVLGYGKGDDVLGKLTKAIRNTCRPVDVACRFGGEEFIIILPRTDSEGAISFAERLRRNIDAEGFFTPAEAKKLGREKFTVSIGVDTYPETMQLFNIGAHQPEEFQGYMIGVGEQLKANAEAALHEAKKSRDTVVKAGNHAENVSSIAGKIAEEMKLPAAEISVAMEAALLHDIGKLRIPHEILLKDKLTPTERVDVQKHPEVGAELILAQEERKRTRDPTAPSVGFYAREGAEAIRHHHERWDGGGYPMGLKGEGIPIVSRIIAVADAFDAMTSANPTREYNNGPRSRQEAIDEIRSQAGKQFDPAVVEAFIKLSGRDEV